MSSQLYVQFAQLFKFARYLLSLDTTAPEWSKYAHHSLTKGLNAP